MNSSNVNILSIKSIRTTNLHIEPLSGEVTQFPSINKAKAHSRVLGGAGKVRSLKWNEVKSFREEYKAAHAKANP